MLAICSLSQYPCETLLLALSKKLSLKLFWPSNSFSAVFFANQPNIPSIYLINIEVDCITKYVLSFDIHQTHFLSGHSICLVELSDITLCDNCMYSSCDEYVGTLL